MEDDSTLLGSVLQRIDNNLKKAMREKMVPQVNISLKQMIRREERLQISDSLYFAHFKLGKGYVTVAAGKSQCRKLTAWGVSFCDPNDQWSRKEGRMRARKNLFDHIGPWGEDWITRSTTLDEDIYGAPQHETCLMVLWKELLVRRPSWYKKNRDKPEVISRLRSLRKMGNLKEIVNLEVVVKPME